MGDLAHTLVLCGLISGLQPLTILGLLLVLGGRTPRANGFAFIGAAFFIQTTILIVTGLVFGGKISLGSDTGRSFVGVRIGVGLVAVVFGLLLRRPPGKPVPEIPHALQRLRDLGPKQSAIAGLVVADYQGPVLAAFALTTSGLPVAENLAGIAFYTVFASGIPLAVMLWTTHSQRARDRITVITERIMRNRRVIASWFLVVAGIALMVDGVWQLA
jgi:hypothetical protein